MELRKTPINETYDFNVCGLCGIRLLKKLRERGDIEMLCQTVAVAE